MTKDDVVNEDADDIKKILGKKIIGINTRFDNHWQILLEDETKVDIKIVFDKDIEIGRLSLSVDKDHLYSVGMQMLERDSNERST
jgi:hypothetical protein